MLTRLDACIRSPFANPSAKMSSVLCSMWNMQQIRLNMNCSVPSHRTVAIFRPAQANHGFGAFFTVISIRFPTIYTQAQLNFSVTVLVIIINIRCKKTIASNVERLHIVRILLDLLAVEFNTYCKYCTLFKKVTGEYPYLQRREENSCSSLSLWPYVFYCQGCSKNLSPFPSSEIFQDRIEASSKHGLLQKFGGVSDLFYMILLKLLKAGAPTLISHSWNVATSSTTTQHLLLKWSVVLILPKWTKSAWFNSIQDRY